ncbi:hypothetical protein KJ870_00510 [bacterium]|nr:hypothetical protein [bacterium]MBU1433412.1 hypothetical protein [bacterium]
MLTIEAMYRHDVRVEAVCEFLSRYFTTGNPTRWKKLFDLPWIGTYPCGYVMLNEAKDIVGFIGTIFADRIIENKTITTCSLSSWAMDETTRGKGLNLIRKFIKQENILFLDLTANEPSRKIFNAFKFQTLDNFEYVFPAFLKFNQEIKIFLEQNININKLSRDEQLILKDHKNTCVKFAQVIYFTESILIAYIEVKRKKLSFIEILYISPKTDFINKNIVKIIRFIAYKENVLGTIISSRFVNIIPKSIYLKRKIKHLIFRDNNPSHIQPTIDTLYTEKVLFCQ